MEAKRQVRCSEGVSEPVHVGGAAPGAPVDGASERPPGLRVGSASVSVHRLRRADRLNALLLALTWILGVAFIRSDPLGVGAVCWGPFVLLGLTAVILGRRHGAAVVGARTVGARGSLVVGGGGVEVALDAGGAGMAWEGVVAGWTETFRDREEVVLETRSGTLVRAAVEGAAQAREVLRAAGVAPEQRAIAIKLGVGETRGTRAILIFMAMLLGPVAAILVLVFLLSLFVWSGASGVALVIGGIAALAVTGLWLVVRPLVTTTVSIGTDGVVIQRLGRRRFVPRAVLRAVEGREGEVVILREKIEPIRLRTSGRAEAAAVIVRIREALASTGDGAVAPQLDRLDRHGRSVADWLRDLRALGAAPGGYRDAALDRRALLDVVEDGRAPAERRIAAAAALSGTPEHDVRARVRVAAQACVDARLREAIERAAEGELEEELVARAVRAARET